MSAYDRVRDILSDRATMNINFCCQGVPVNSALFAEVRSAVGDTTAGHCVSVMVNPGLLAAYRAGALYSEGTNAIWVRDAAIATLWEEAAVVHESVHCGFDIGRRAGWPWFGQEACAYIAGARYALNKGMQASNVALWGSIHAAAVRIAAVATNGAQVTWEQYYPLRMALLKSSRIPQSAYYGRLPTDCTANDGL